jgi:hypothetical protein
MIVTLVLAAVVVVALTAWYRFARARNVPCAVDLESTEAHFHAHVALEGFEVDAGDEVLVHGTPSRIPLGAQITFRSNATVRPASRLKRGWVKLTGGTEFHELYDVGFEG